jgi:type II secretory pathway pseudopilin PulG
MKFRAANDNSQNVFGRLFRVPSSGGGDLAPLIGTGLQPGDERGEEAPAASAASTACDKPLKRLVAFRSPNTGLKSGVNETNVPQRSRHGFSLRRTNRGTSAFTLAEVLAALVFMAIVIPVAVSAMHIAATAGVIAERKAAAVRVAERVLNESVVMTNWNQSAQNGTVYENGREFQWTIRNETWPQDAMRLLTAEVKFKAQDRNYAVQISTLVNQ